MTKVKLVQLVDCQGGPYDLVSQGRAVTYADLSTAAGLRAISRYADQVGFCKDVMIPRTADGTLGQPTPVIKDAHRAGLTVVRVDVPQGELVPAGRVPQQCRPGCTG